MTRIRGRLIDAVKAVRSVPAVNSIVTYTVRAALRVLPTSGEVAIKHLPRQGITRASLPNGRTIRLWSRGDDWVSNQVFWRGWEGYEPEVSPLFWQLAQTARVTLDVGAHVGFYSLLAAAANPEGRVFAFEPLPAVFARLQRNLELNAFTNMEAIECAAGAEDTIAQFFHVPSVIPCSSSLSAEFMRDHRRVESIAVRVARLDTFGRERKLDDVDLVKLDTETTEPDVLAGLSELLAQSRPDIVCEVLPRADGKRLTAILASYGYGFYLLTDCGPQLRHEVGPDSRWFNYLFSVRALT